MEKTLDTLKQHNFEFKKRFGQNFITDTNLLEAICTDAELLANDQVLEIGTGAGTLTKVMAKHVNKVLTVEVDNDLRSVLHQTFENFTNIELCFADFMKVSASEVNSHFSGSFKVVANLPYYITTPIIFKLIGEQFNVSSITLMVQKEVAERLCANHSTKDYSSMTAQVQSVADVSLKRIVNKKMFTPVPKVDSAIVNIKLNYNKFNIQDLTLHGKVIETAFSMRRKTLANCLKTKLGLTQSQVESLFSKLNFNLNIRGEQLSVEQFVSLSNAIYLLKTQK